MAKKVVLEQVAIFGEAPDFDAGTYTFIADYLPYASGDGMEHRNSTILTSSRALSTSAIGLLGTLSHEFFHAWNVERIRPRALEPFDFERANMSGELWFAEGFTSYYGPLVIHRAGLVPLEQYAANLAGNLDGVINGTGRRYFSPVEMSLQAPFVDAAASIDPQNKANTFISYYTWGAAIGLGLDLTLRSRFTGVTLDDLMRDLWRTHGTTERPYTHDDLRAALGRVTRDTAFARDFFARYIEGREVVDYAALLARAGIRLRRASAGRAFIGGAFVFEGDSAVLAGPAIVGTPLYEAGLDRGDRIVSLGGRPLTSEAGLEAILAETKPGDRLAVEFVQRGATQSRTIVVGEDPRLEATTFEKAGERITPATRTFRERWLASRSGR
jgi:predicted metalloprotease with PDZ domain